jgi:hypothetical protein
LVRIGQVVLTVLVTWFIVNRVGLGMEQLQGIEASAWIPSPLPLLAASALLLGAYFLSAAIWGEIVHDLGGPRLPIAESVQLFMIANLGRYVPGKVWQMAGLAALAQTRGVPVRTGMGAAVLGQGLALVAAAGVGTLALLSGPENLRPLGVAGSLGIGIVVVLIGIPRVFNALAVRWFRLARSEFPEGLRSAHGLRWLGLYALNWVMYAVSFWGLCMSFGLEGAILPVSSAFAAAYVLGYLMLFAPAGLGPREGFLIALLTPQFGVASSGMIAIVARLWTTIVEILPAGFFWMRYLRGSR